MSVQTLAPRRQSSQTSAVLRTMGDGSSNVSSAAAAAAAAAGTERTHGERRLSGSDGGILNNPHEAPKRNAKNDTGIRSALKAAFVPPQPGKQMKTNGKPLGKTFHRKEPLPQKHEGGVVLKVDPRGPNAPCGDGVVLNSPGGTDEGEETETSTATTPGQSNDSLLVSSESSGQRSRSGTGSTVLSSVSSNDGGSSRENPCSIKFAPLPTSGRLKRANSITIGVAARSQLLHSQGAGRQASNGNAQMWQQAYNQQQQQQQQQQRPSGQPSSQSNAGSRFSGIQPQQDTIDLGDELRKGALKAWDRVRRGSSASRSSEGSERPRSNSSVSTPLTEDDEEKEESDAVEGAGDKTPKRAQSPVEALRKTADNGVGGETAAEEEGMRTPRRRQSMPRRVSTGAFTGHASFREMEEKRKRGDLGEQQQQQGDAERENEATRFIEMLGHTGAGNEAFHRAEGPQLKRGDGRSKVVDVVHVDEDNSGSSDSTSIEQDDQKAEDEDDDEDDEETREAEKLAEQALKGHSDKAMKAGGVEKMEKKRSAFGLARK